MRGWQEKMYLNENLGQHSINTSGHDPSSPSSPPSLSSSNCSTSPPPSSSSSSPSSTFFSTSFSVGEDLDSDHGSGEIENRFMARDEARLCGTDRNLISSSAFFGDVMVVDDTKTLVSSSSLLSISFSSSVASWPMHVTLGDDGSPSSPTQASTPVGHPMLWLRVMNIGLNRSTLLCPSGQQEAAVAGGAWMHGGQWWRTTSGQRWPVRGSNKRQRRCGGARMRGGLIGRGVRWRGRRRGGGRGGDDRSGDADLLVGQGGSRQARERGHSGQRGFLFFNLLIKILSH